MIPVPFRVGLCALVYLFFLAAPAQAQVYRWVDANGRVQYSDRKPPDGRQQAQEVRNTVSSVGSQPIGASATSEGKSTAEVERDLQKQRQEQADAQKKQQASAAEQKAKSDNCTAARRNLATLNSGQRISRFNEKGEKSYLDDSGRAREVERAQQQIKANCG
jgi:Domain of unknown function (DUF4124)